MKIIQALKLCKDLEKKADDYIAMVRDHCAISSVETQKYADQKEQVRQWIQGHSDILKEILRLRTAIQRTNLQTNVTVELQGKQVTKTIAEWIHRRRDLANKEMALWNAIGDKGIKEGMANGPSGQPIEIKIVRFYEPGKREEMRMALSSEPSTIDAHLEIANAVTDLIE